MNMEDIKDRDQRSPALESLTASDLKIRSEQPRGRLGNFSKVGNAEGKGKKKDSMPVKKIPSSTSMSSYKQ
jgi:hypothetical protein